MNVYHRASQSELSRRALPLSPACAFGIDKARGAAWIRCCVSLWPLAPNPILNFEIDRGALRYTGTDLQRPECILAERDGTLWAADARGGVIRILPDGTQEVTRQKRSGSFEDAASEATRYLEGTLPNGMAFARYGDFLIANFGTDCLEVMSRSGELKVLADSINGQPIGKVNFVLRDSKDRLWVTVSTKVKNWMNALRTDLKDGYIACYEDGAFRIVADGFGFTNEIRFDAREEFLYIVETTGGCITRMRVNAKGVLSNREIFGPTHLGKGAWPDGIAFDVCGKSVGNDGVFGQVVRADARWRPAYPARRGRSRKSGCAGAPVLQ